MADKLWKSAERKVAALLGGKRNFITGRMRDEGIADVDHELFSIEVKHRKSAIAAWIIDGMDQAVKSKKTPEHIPIVVLHEKGQKYEDCNVLIKLSDLVKLYEMLKDGK